MEKINNNKTIYGLDKMRVFAISIILVYHFAPTVLPAGFLGVNMFFTISGFLMTFHALKEINETKNFSFTNFYTKRYNRIVPGLILMLLVSIILVFFVNSDYRVDIAKQVASTFSFSTNWYEIISGGSYEAQFIKHIFVHTWFLSLEIHFYIFWYFILCLIVKVSKKLRIRRYIKLVFLSSILIAFISYVILFIGIINFKNNINWLYLSDFTRFASFFVGSALACIPVKINIKNKNIVSLLIYVSILIMSIFLNYNNIFTYLLGFFVVDILSVILISIYLSTDKKDASIFTVLSKYSYGLYLFHWPLLVIISSAIKGILGYIIIIVLTILITLFNQKVWEPLFTAKDNNKTRSFSNYSSYHSKRKNNLGGLIALSSVFLLLILTSLAEFTAPEMVALKKGIFINSISQDIEKIQLDYEDLNTYLGKDIKDTSTKKPSSNSSEKNTSTKGNLKNKSVTVIGDSVLLGPRKYIMKNTPNTFVDSEGFRLLDKGFEVVNSLNKQNKIGDYLVIALGTNCIEDPTESLEKILEEVPSKTRVIFVTPLDINIDQHRVGVAMKNVAKKYDFITLMDWESFGHKNPQLYEGTDGIHFYGKEDTYKAYVKLLKETLNKASKTPTK